MTWREDLLARDMRFAEGILALAQGLGQGPFWREIEEFLRVDVSHFVEVGMLQSDGRRQPVLRVINEHFLIRWVYI
jgi:hypothetical protein